jgi:hypothetical protein
MRTFHFAFYTDPTVALLGSVNIQGETLEIALQKFREKYSFATINYIHDKTQSQNGTTN